MTVEGRKQVADFISAHPELTYHQCAKVHSCSIQTIARIAGEFGIRRRTGYKAHIEPENSKLSPVSGTR
jgi:hypothetical protein